MNIKLHRILISFYTIILIISCDKTDTDKLDYDFIESYYQLDSNCLNAIRQILAPSHIEDKEYKISKVYALNVKNDSTWPYPQRLSDVKSIFIGLIFEPDSFDLNIMNIVPEYGSIYQCGSIENNSRLVIKNCRMKQSNLYPLGEQNCLDFDTSFHFQHFTERQLGVWEGVNPESLIGNWIRNIEDASRFQKEIFNNKWKLTKQKDFFIISDSDTLLAAQYEMYSDTLFIRPDIDTFRIWSYTDDLLVLSKFGSKDTHIFERP